MDSKIRGIVIFAVAYFVLFVALEWYIARAFSADTVFYESPEFGIAVIVYVAVVAAMLLRYRSRGRK